jgi:hypothetical protein
MPTVFRRDGYRFFFFSNEGDPANRRTFMCAGPATKRSSGCGLRLLWPKALGLTQRN